MNVHHVTGQTLTMARERIGQSATADAPRSLTKHRLANQAFGAALVAGDEIGLFVSSAQPAPQEWEHPSLWTALGGEPDTDFVQGQCEGTLLTGAWIVSHHNGPELAIAQALRRRRKRARVQGRAESPDKTESSSSEDRGWQSDPALQHVSNSRPLSPTEQALDTTIANTPTSASFQIWEVIIDQLFAHGPGNGWALTFNPHEQHLEGEAAQSFLNCRETCTAFDHYMLGYVSRFTMQPIKYLRAERIEIEFEQREFFVSATRAASLFNDILYSEYRIYSRKVLRVRRDLVRTSPAHDSRWLLHDDLEVRFWVDQTEAAHAGPISRRTTPWFLSREEVDKFHEQCRHATWTHAEHQEQTNEANAHQEQADCDNTSQGRNQAGQATGCLR